MDRIRKCVGSVSFESGNYDYMAYQCVYGSGCGQSLLAFTLDQTQIVVLVVFAQRVQINRHKAAFAAQQLAIIFRMMSFDVTLQVNRLNATVFAFSAFVFHCLLKWKKTVADMSIYTFKFTRTHVIVTHFVLPQSGRICSAKRTDFTLHWLLAGVLPHVHLKFGSPNQNMVSELHCACSRLPIVNVPPTSTCGPTNTRKYYNRTA